LRERRPDDGLVGEEGTADAATHSRVRWLVDPIDGTVNFTLGLPQYAVSVAAEVDGAVVAGCVANPVTGDVFRAVRGHGAYRQAGAAGPGGPGGPAMRLTGPRDISLERAVIGTGFGYDTHRRARQGAVVAQLLPRIGDIRRAGSASLDLCAVAAGWLDGYFEAGLNVWDYAAGLLIATEAGGISSGLTGQAAGERFCAVAGPGLGPDLFALLEELGAGAVLD
jgi:myo-inositol-1(or 4)-monophosphatase